jgi:hypothetical protein
MHLSDTTTLFCFYLLSSFPANENWKSGLEKVRRIFFVLVKGKANPLHALRGPEGSRRLRLPDFKTIGT